ncbi:MAG: hypothetical protein ABEH56_04295 [Salinirussus sp.]
MNPRLRVGLAGVHLALALLLLVSVILAPDFTFPLLLLAAVLLLANRFLL